MSSAFRRNRDGTVRVTFHPAEVALLTDLETQLRALLGGDDAAAPAAGPADSLETLLADQGPVEPPSDPALRRLLPDAYQGDDEAAAEFRRFTERTLRDGKVAGIDTVLHSLADPGDSDRVTVRLSPGDAQAWLRNLTDLRLTLGSRLAVEEEDDARWAGLADDDPARQAHDVYLWLGWLQETLVHAVAG